MRISAPAAKPREASPRRTPRKNRARSAAARRKPKAASLVPGSVVTIQGRNGGYCSTKLVRPHWACNKRRAGVHERFRVVKAGGKGQFGFASGPWTDQAVPSQAAIKVRRLAAGRYTLQRPGAPSGWCQPRTGLTCASRRGEAFTIKCVAHCRGTVERRELGEDANEETGSEGAWLRIGT